jgi:AcrR family transcriptional regulator
MQQGQQTRQLIAETAWRLFADRGFEQVTVAEVARKAQVAVATVFNYFPTKEDVFYYRLEAFGAGLVDAISTRAEGEPVLVAFRRSVLESAGLLAQVEAGDSQALERLRTVNRVIAASRPCWPASSGRWPAPPTPWPPCSPPRPTPRPATCGPRSRRTPSSASSAR